jgi:F-type H+-transporting ATPase subunit alpha
MEIMKQGVHQTLPVAKQVAIIYAATNGYLDDVDVSKVRAFEAQLHDALDATYADYVRLFNEKKAMADDVKKSLDHALTDFKRTFKG